MEPGVGEQPQPEQSKSEYHRLRAEKIGERIADVRQKFGEKGRDKVVAIRNQNKEIFEKLASLAQAEGKDVEDAAVKAEIDARAKVIESAFQTLEDDLRTIEEESLASTDSYFKEFVEERKKLFASIDTLIDKVADDPTAKEDLFAIRTNLLKLDITNEEKALKNAKDKKNLLKKKMSELEIIEDTFRPVASRIDLERAKKEGIAEREKAAKAKVAADKAAADKAVAYKAAKDQTVADRAGKARAELGKALGSAESPEKAAEKLQAHMPEIIATVFEDFLGDPRKSKEQIQKEKALLLNTILWDLLGKTGEPQLNPDGTLKITDKGERDRLQVESEVLDKLFKAAEEYIKNEAASRIAKEKSTKSEKVKFWGEIAVLGGAGVLTGTVATGGTLLVALGGITAVRILRGFLADRTVHGKPVEVAREWKANENKKKELEQLLQGFFVAQHHERIRTDKSAGTPNILDGLRGKVAAARNPSERNAIISDYRTAARARANQLQSTIELRFVAEGLSAEEARAIAQSSADLYVMDQIHLLVEKETETHLAKGRYGEGKFLKGAEKVIDTVSLTKQVKEKWKNAAVMGTIGLVARELPIIREVMMAYGGMQAGAAFGEMAHGKVEKWRGKETLPPPTIQEFDSLREEVQTIDPNTKEGREKLMDLTERVKLRMADARLYLTSEGAKKRGLERAVLQRSLEGLEDMLAAQTATIGLDGKMEELYETVREKGAKVVGKEESRRTWKFIGAAAGLALGVVAGEYLRHSAERMQVERIAARDEAITASKNARLGIVTDVREATAALTVATIAKDAAQDAMEKVTETSASTASLGDMSEHVETVRTAAGKAREGATEAAKQLAEAEANEQLAQAAAAKAAKAAERYGTSWLGEHDDTYEKAMAAKGFTAADAADAHANVEAARKLAHEADTAAKEAEGFFIQAEAALEIKEKGEVFSDALRHEQTGYHPIGEPPPVAGALAPSPDNPDHRWFGGTWNADGKGTGPGETLRYSLGAKNFMHARGMSVNEESGKIILGHDNEDITFRGGGAAIKHIEIAHHADKVLSDGEHHECVSVTTIDVNNNVRVMYIRDDGQYHQDFSGDVPRTGSWESQVSDTPPVDGKQYMPTGALGKGDVVTGLEYHAGASGSGGFLSASEMKGADGVVRRLHLLDQDNDGSLSVDDVAANQAQYGYEELGRDGHTVVDQGALTPDGRTSYMSIIEAQKAMGVSSTLDASRATTQQAAEVLKDLKKHPVSVSTDSHIITFADAKDLTRITTAKLDLSPMGSEVTASVDATKVDIKVGNTIVIQNATLSIGKDGSLLIDGKALEEHTKIGEAILKQDIAAKHLSQYSSHEAVAQALGVHVENNHLIIPKDVDAKKLNIFLASTGKLNACGNNAEHLRFAFTHDQLSVNQLTSIFKSQDIFHTALEKSVSLEQASALQEAFREINLQPTIDGHAINFEYNNRGFVIDHDGVHLKGAGGRIVVFPLTKDPAEFPLDLEKIGNVKEGMKNLAGRAAIEQKYVEQLQAALTVGGKADVDLGKITNMRYGDTQQKETFFKALGVREYKLGDPRSWFGAGVSANRTYSKLTMIFNDIKKESEVSFDDKKSVADNIRFALEQKFK